MIFELSVFKMAVSFKGRNVRATLVDYVVPFQSR